MLYAVMRIETTKSFPQFINECKSESIVEIASQIRRSYFENKSGILFV